LKGRGGTLVDQKGQNAEYGRRNVGENRRERRGGKKINRKGDIECTLRSGGGEKQHRTKGKKRKGGIIGETYTSGVTRN